MASMKTRTLLWGELTALYFLAPLLYATKLVPVAPLWFFGVYLLLVAKTLVTHSWRQERRELGVGELLLYLLVPALTLVALAKLTGHMDFMPTKKSALFLRILFFYPVLSVIPQELIYRVAFFKRYRNLLSNPLGFILLNAMAFSILHTIYMNPYALGLTFCGGALYGYLRMKGASLGELILLHAFHGLTLFSVGLGQFFYINLFASPGT